MINLMVYSAYARYIPYIYSGMVYLRPLCRISHVGYIMWQVKIRIANQNHKLQIFLAAVPRKKKIPKKYKKCHSKCRRDCSVHFSD